MLLFQSLHSSLYFLFFTIFSIPDSQSFKQPMLWWHFALFLGKHQCHSMIQTLMKCYGSRMKKWRKAERSNVQKPQGHPADLVQAEAKKSEKALDLEGWEHSAPRNKHQLINMVNRCCEICPTVSHLRAFLEFITFVLAGSCCSRFSRCYDNVNKWIKHLLCVLLRGSFSYTYSRLHIIYHCTNNCNSIPAQHVQYI